MRVPLSTYRVQLNAERDFLHLYGVVPYLSSLGIGDVYASPVFRPVAGSSHGYDVIDPTTVSPELEKGITLPGLLRYVKDMGMGWIQDIVPNHMAFHSHNPLLRKIMELGPRSEYYRYFDVDWDHPNHSLNGRLLVPVLGKFYSSTMREGDIRLEYNDSGLSARYYEHDFPLKLESYVTVFGESEKEAAETIGHDNPQLLKYLGVVHQFGTLARTAGGVESYDGVRHAKSILWELYLSDEKVQHWMDSRVAFYNGDGDSLNRLDALLESQTFRLAFWKVAAEEIDYRRFFNVNGLICLRVEDDGVFDFVHRGILPLVEDSLVTGLRIDHVDGLYDPNMYLHRLRSFAPDSYIIVEKILNRDEIVPASWPVEGTTGYDFLNMLNGIYCKRENEKAFGKLYDAFTGNNVRYEELLAEKKRLIIGKHMAGDIDNLARLLEEISGGDMDGRDITIYGLRRALVEVIAFFPVYRTYIDRDGPSPTDREWVRVAIERARKWNPSYSYEYDFIWKCLNLEYDAGAGEEKIEKLLHFVMRFQQYTAPMMAKGLEDTVLYVSNRLLSLNEVGGSPERFGTGLPGFHDFMLRRCRRHRYSMNATSTHDTKRGEDVRARLNALSELPHLWRDSLRLWNRINHGRRKNGLDGPVPDRNDEYFIYQTLLGTFPFDMEDYESYVVRIREYMIKAIREAKVHTAWIKPDLDYEGKILSFVDRLLLPAVSNRFLDSFIPVQKKIAFYGIVNSLSQTLVKLAAPGVPDFDQGTELWDLNLVDPDNRGPVDYNTRMAHLDYITGCRDMEALARELWQSRQDGRVKLFLVHRALMARRDNPALFLDGSYVPLNADGRFANSVISFMRVDGDDVAVAVAPRFLSSLAEEGDLPVGEIWQDTAVTVPFPVHLTDRICGHHVQSSGRMLLSEILRCFPVALLTGKQERQPEDS